MEELAPPRSAVDPTPADVADLLAASAVGPAGRSRPVVCYIDADNQPAFCARALVATFHNAFGVRVVSAAVAGNSHGKVVHGWRSELMAQDPAIAVRGLEVPPRRHAADIALLMELGASLDRHIRERELVVVVSRDDLLLGAAEHARMRGCPVLVAYVQTETPVARTLLPTLLLPAGGPAPSAPAPDPPTVTSASGPAGTSVASVLAQVREMCVQRPGGGYAATDVGQALLKLGFASKPARVAFLKSVPQIAESGSGPDKTLRF